jgi:predicted nucleic acid-binding protein
MIVFDASTLILLAKTEMLDILIRDHKGGFIISGEVEKESTEKKTFDALLIKKRIEDGKLKVKNVHDNTVEKIMTDFKINRGEAESIVLALENKGSILATDDKNTMNACKLLHVPFVTAIAIVIRTREKNLLTKEESYTKINELSKYGRYKKEIIEDAKKRLR